MVSLRNLFFAASIGFAIRSSWRNSVDDWHVTRVLVKDTAADGLSSEGRRPSKRWEPSIIIAPQAAPALSWIP